MINNLQLGADVDNNNQLNKCYSLIRNQDTAVIATATRSGRPHASIVNYFMHDSLDLYFISREDAQKYKNIKENSYTCLVICNSEFTSSVEVNGEAEQLEDSPKVNKLLSKYADIIRRRNAGPLPIMKYPGSELYLFKLTPLIMRYADFNIPSSDEGDFFEVHLRKDD